MQIEIPQIAQIGTSETCARSDCVPPKQSAGTDFGRDSTNAGAHVREAEASQKVVRLSRIQLLWSARRNLGLVMLLGTVVATIISFSIPARFQSTTRLIVAGYGPISSSSAVDAEFFGTTGAEAVLAGVLKSRTVQDGLIARFGLNKVYGVRKAEDARAHLAHNTTIDEKGDSGIITIKVTDRRAERAVELCNAYGEELNRTIAQLTMESIHQQRLFLEQRVKTAKFDLDFAAKQSSEFASDNAVVDVEEQGRVIMNSEQSLRAKLIAAKGERESLKQVYAVNNEQVMELSGRIRGLQNGIEKLGGTGSEDSYAPERSTKPQRSVDIGQSTEEDHFYPSLRGLPLANVVFSDLFRRTASREATYEALSLMLETAKIHEIKSPTSVDILDYASMPEKKSYPPRGLIICMGSLLSEACAIAWILGRSTWRALDLREAAQGFD